MRIFDRCGSSVFDRNNLDPQDMSQGWKGEYDGQQLSSGVYAYAKQFTMNSGESVDINGSVTLIR